MTRKFLSIYFPNWSINRVATNYNLEQSRNGILLTLRKNNQDFVARYCHVAQRTKAINRGSTLSLAKAFLPNAIVEPLNSKEDFKRLYKAAIYYYKFTPLVSLDLETLEAYKANKLDNLNSLFFGLNLDLTGLEKLYRERDLIQEINISLLKARVESKMAIAPTLGMAWGLARFSPERVTCYQNDTMNALLETLSIDALRLNPEIANSLKEVGIYTVDLLKKFPKTSLLERFGKESLIRFEQFFGLRLECITPIKMPNTWSLTKEFDFPLSRHDEVVQTILMLLLELFKTLKDKGKTARTFCLFMLMKTEDGSFCRDSKEFSFYAATLNKTHLKAVITPLVENLKIVGAIQLLVLSAKNVVNYKPPNASILMRTVESEIATDELLDFLVSKLGDSNITKIGYEENYLPEKSFSFSPVTEKKVLNSNCKIRYRPSVILNKHEEVNVVALIPDCFPSRIIWKNKILKIKSGMGPERIEAPNLGCVSSADVRDYFKIQDQKGRWLWIYRENKTEKWFIQGLWI